MTVRNPLIDGLKVLASQLIVFHHLATYGPLSDVWDAAALQSSDWLFDYGKMAVQVFLVIGGFLAARGLDSAGGLSLQLAGHLVRQRYLRLVLPLLAALLIAIPSAWLARSLASYQFFPAAPTWGQWLAHAFLLHNVLGVESLSAGVWYVAIDLHAYMLVVGLFLFCGRWVRVGVLLVMLASLFYFNRDAGFDVGPLYFFGAYGMGMVAYWASQSRRMLWHMVLLVAVGLAALWFDFRARIAIALCVAQMLASTAQWQYPDQKLHAWHARCSATVQALANTSYALFLVHFSILMIANALFDQWGQGSAARAAAFIALCWALSMGLAVMFERWIERPIYRRLARSRN